MKTASIHLRLLLFCLVVSLFSVTAVAQAPPSADTYVTKVSPSTNFGSAPVLAVQEGTTTYLQFDLSSLQFDLSSLPQGASIGQAMLKLHVNSVFSAGWIDAYSVNGPWTEDTINYLNAPLLGASATGGHPIAVTDSSIGRFIILDITRLVQDWASGTTPKNGLALAVVGEPGGPTASLTFDSNESRPTGNPPELAIVAHRVKYQTIEPDYPHPLSCRPPGYCGRPGFPEQCPVLCCCCKPKNGLQMCDTVYAPGILAGGAFWGGAQSCAQFCSGFGVEMLRGGQECYMQ